MIHISFIKNQSLTLFQVHHTGFFSVIGTGFTREEVERQYDIGQSYLNLPLEEKGDPKYRCDFANGNYFGFRAVRLQLPSSIPILKPPSAGTREESNEH
jgi:hypothetical protein